MSFKVISSRVLAVCLAVLMVNVPQFLSAQTVSDAPAAQTTQTAPPQNSQAQAAQPSNSQAPTTQPAPSPNTQASPPSPSAIPNPSQGPLQPVPTARPVDNNAVPPDAPSEVQRGVQEQQEQQTAPASAPVQPIQEQLPPPPLGTATAQQGVTRGGLASRPAGEAIAPAKQRQVRSLVIKIALVAAAAAAVGTVVGLTRATSSIPPGAH